MRGRHRRPPVRHRTRKGWLARMDLLRGTGRGLLRRHDEANRRQFRAPALAGAAHEHDSGAEFAFFLHSTKELDDEERRFLLSKEDIALLNPNTRTCPIFRTRRDAEITKRIYRAAPVLVRDGDPEGNPWSLTIRRIFNMGIPEVVDMCVEHGDREASGRDDLVPMYEAKLVHQFDHRFATYRNGGAVELEPADKADPHVSITRASGSR